VDACSCQLRCHFACRIELNLGQIIERISLLTGQKEIRSMATFRFQSLDIYRVARDICVLVQDARIKDTELRDQATRAAKSCFLNLSEGLPSDQAGVRRRHFAIANGSLAELSAAVDLAATLGAVDANAARQIEASSERFAMMLRKLNR
jgi:four helix bundle protein